MVTPVEKRYSDAMVLSMECFLRGKTFLLLVPVRIEYTVSLAQVSSVCKSYNEGKWLFGLNIFKYNCLIWLNTKLPQMVVCMLINKYANLILRHDPEKVVDKSII